MVENTTAEAEEARSASTQADNEQSVTELLAEVNERLEDMDQGDVAAMTDGELSELRENSRSVEKRTEEIRKDVVDSEIEDRDGVPGFSVVESHRKFVEGDEQSIIMRAVSHGIDPSQFTTVNATQLSEVDEEVEPHLGDVGKYLFTYVRRE